MTLVKKHINSQTVGLPNLGFTGDDVRPQLSKAAESGIAQIINALETEYHLRTIPEVVQKRLRMKAYLIYASYCELLIDDLKEASRNPDIKL